MSSNNKSVQTHATPSFVELLQNPIYLLAFGFGSGKSPFAPGTMGTLVALALYMSVAHFSRHEIIGIALVLIIFGIFICDRTARDLNVHDHPGIVWDEIAGFFVTMSFAPIGWMWAVFGFVLFRVFDIAKPWPICVIDQKVHGGLGIMLDDVVAGIMAGLVLVVLSYFI